METRKIIFTRDAQLKFTRFASGATVAKEGATADANPEKLGTLSGYAMTWGGLSEPDGGVVFRLLPGSPRFTTPCLALYHHDFAKLLGNTGNNSLRLTPDTHGIACEIDLPQTATAKELEELIETGTFAGGGMSFLMLMGDGNFKGKVKTENGQQVMEVSQFTCPEVSVTIIPSFSGTSIGITEDDACECDCPECKSGDCDNCSCVNCQCDNCSCGSTMEAAKPLTAHDRTAQSLKLQKIRLDNLEI